jgi:hypothetical protein
MQAIIVQIPQYERTHVWEQLSPPNTELTLPCRREGPDVYVTSEIPLVQSLLGTTITVRNTAHWQRQQPAQG